MSLFFPSSTNIEAQIFYGSSHSHIWKNTSHLKICFSFSSLLPPLMIVPITRNSCKIYFRKVQFWSFCSGWGNLKVHRAIIVHVVDSKDVLSQLGFVGARVALLSMTFMKYLNKVSCTDLWHEFLHGSYFAVWNLALKTIRSDMLSS